MPGILLIALVVLACLVVGGVGLSRAVAPREMKNPIQGTITQLDIAARTATIEFVHPKTGQVVQQAGNVPLECTILVNDQPAELADLAVGMEIRARGRIHVFPARRLEALEVRVDLPDRGSSEESSSSVPTGDAPESAEFEAASEHD